MKRPSETTSTTLEFASSVGSPSYITTQTGTLASSAHQPSRGLLSFSDVAAYLDEKFHLRKPRSTDATGAGRLDEPQHVADENQGLQPPEELVIDITHPHRIDDVDNAIEITNGGDGPSRLPITNV